MSEKHTQATESNRPFILVRIPAKYGTVTCRVDTMNRRFYTAAIDELKTVYNEYKAKMDSDPEYKSHPVFNGSKTHGWVQITEVMEPYAEDIAEEFCAIAADMSNTTTQAIGIGNSRF